LSGKKRTLAEEEMDQFFAFEVAGGLDDLERFLELLEQYLQENRRVTLILKGYASPLNNPVYNENLTRRRISSLENYLYSCRNGIFRKFMVSGQLQIERRAFGEATAPDYISDDLRDQRNSVYSPVAARERKIQIESILFE
jgi:hypothetical protein